jgi:hypothetical protein
MNTKKEMSIAVIFLATAIIFVSSTPMTNHAFAKSHDGQDSLGGKYENFLNCLSDAAGPDNYPADDQIVNCISESGYIQGSSSTSNTADSEEHTGSSSTSNTADSEEHTGNVDVSIVGDDSSDDGADDSSDDGADDSSDDGADDSSDDGADDSSDDGADDSSDK